MQGATVSTVTVRPITTRQDEATFIRFPWKIYTNMPAWVPPLLMDRKKLIDRKKNPFYKHAEAEFFLAERDGEIVGRIGAILNHNHNKEHNERIGFFGFFESVDDQQVANALFDAARAFLAPFNITALRGPANPSVNDEYGMLIDGYDVPPMVLMPYNPPYYNRLVEAYGFRKEKDLYAYLLNQDEVYTDRLERAAQVVRERYNIVFRSLNMKKLNDEVALIKEVYNSAWQHNWGEVPMTDEEMDAMAADLKAVVVPDLVIIAEYQGNPIGFGLTLPDINMALKYNKKGFLLPGIWHLLTKKKNINACRIIALGVKPEYLKTGAGGVLFYETARRAKRLGYHFGGASWILEDNDAMNKSAVAMKGTITKKYRIYQMNV